MFFVTMYCILICYWFMSQDSVFVKLYISFVHTTVDIKMSCLILMCFKHKL